MRTSLTARFRRRDGTSPPQGAMEQKRGVNCTQRRTQLPRTYYNRVRERSYYTYMDSPRGHTIKLPDI